MRSSPIVAKRLVRTVTLLVAWAATSITLNAAAPPAGEREQIEKLIGSYYLAVAAENVDEVVDLHHWANSFERDKVRALTQQAFSVADSSFERVRVVSVDLFPERNIGLARVTVDARVTSFDGSDAFDTHLETVIVVVRGSRGWRIGRVARAADFDLTAAASQYAGLSQELEATVPPASEVEAGTAQGHGKLPKLAAATAAADPGAPSRATGVNPSASSAPAESGFTFLALRRKANGACEVVAGAEGISPGDTVLGAFPDFNAALRAAAAGCGGADNIAPQESRAEMEAGALTTERLYEPDDTVTRGAWGTVARIADEHGFASATDDGQPVGDGFFVHPGSGGPTEIVYRHDGSPVTLQGRATIIDCLAHCGRGGTVTFAVTGDGSELWNSGMVRHDGPGLAFSINLEGVSEVRLISTDGGNGNGEDWAAWLDLEVVASTTQQAAQSAASISPSPTEVSPILAVPIFSADDSTTGLFVVDLEDGSAVFVPDVNADPRNLRATPVNHNIFTVLGRPFDRPARPGEILAGEIRAPSGEGRGLLVVETSTGSAVFLEDVGDGPDRVVLRRINGHPAGAIASGDGNFALLMRRDGSGSTDGAYLYHATSGRCLYFAHVDDMSPDTRVEFTSPLPVMTGRVAALELQSGGEATPQALLIDGGSGLIYRVGALEHQPSRISVTREPLDLFTFFPPSSPDPTLQRFTLVPVFAGDGATDAVLVIDGDSGRMAALSRVFKRGGVRLVGSPQDLLGHLRGGDGRPKILAAAPKVGASGATDGAWVFDSGTGDVLFLENIRDPLDLRIRHVARQTP